MIIKELCKNKLLHPPKWLADNTVYLTVMGSHAYGVNHAKVLEDSEKIQDIDYYGVVIPPKQMVFPHLNGQIPGFGWQKINTFNQWQEMALDESGPDTKKHDFNVYNIVRYMQLCMQNNPNMVDSLFTPENCVIHITPIGQLIRENRKKFLSRLCWLRFSGYAQSQIKKMQTRNPEGERKKIVEKYGFDTKYAYHLIRLLDESEQILTTGDLDLQRSKKVLAAIRQGEWTAEEVIDYATEKRAGLEAKYQKSDLPPKPDETEIRNLLLQCLEMHYGNIDNCIHVPDWSLDALKQIRDVLDRYEDRISQNLSQENPKSWKKSISALIKRIF